MSHILVCLFTTISNTQKPKAFSIFNIFVWKFQNEWAIFDLTICSIYRAKAINLHIWTPTPLKMEERGHMFDPVFVLIFQMRKSLYINLFIIFQYFHMRLSESRRILNMELANTNHGRFLIYTLKNSRARIPNIGELFWDLGPKFP